MDGEHQAQRHADRLGQHRDSHRQPGGQPGDSVHHLAPGGDSGHIGRLAELAYHHQIYCTIHGLQNSASSTGMQFVIIYKNFRRRHRTHLILPQHIF